MKLKEISALRMEPVVTASRRPRQSQDRQDQERPGLRAALLGLVCVIGVFALLGVLYSVG